jgi:prepilin-type N-terminal cleavage/methylation domain-containing protein
MKLKMPPNQQASNQTGFTLIEMIGVLAVIAILASLLIPKVFSAIADAKINNTAVGVETVKTAIADHYGKYGRFDTFFGTNTPPGFTAGTTYTNYDINVLMPEALLDKPFQTKLGTSWTVQFRNCAAVGAVGDTDPSYALDGGANNTATGQYVVECIIAGVPEADAQSLSQKLDGPGMSTPLGTPDHVGRVKYGAPDATGATIVYVYLTHR